MTQEIKASSDFVADISAMHRHFKVKESEMTQQRLVGRLNFLREEIDEAVEAAESGNANDLVDAHIDAIVVAIGNLDIFGVDIREAWARVFAANMAKIPGAKSTRPDMGGVDLIKPEGWMPPDHSDNVGLLPDLLDNFNMKKFDKVYSIKEMMDQPHRYSMEVLHECIKDFNPDKLLMTKDVDYLMNHVSIMMAELLKGVDSLRNGNADIGSIEARIKHLIYSIADVCCFFEQDQKLIYKSPVCTVIRDAMQIQMKKAHDYNSDVSIHQADYYPHGIDHILYMVHMKILRFRSVFENMKLDKKAKNESIQDSFKDAINYASFAISWLRGKLEGQNPENDVFNIPKSDLTVVQMAKTVNVALSEVASDRNFENQCDDYIKGRAKDGLNMSAKLIERLGVKHVNEDGYSSS